MKSSITYQETEKTVTPLASDPQLFANYCSKLGLNTNVASFYDIFSFDEELFNFIPHPVYAVIFNFPFCQKDLITRYSQPIPDDNLPSPRPWFSLQTVRNACGTFALLHALLNNFDKIGVEKNSWLNKFHQKTLNLSPSERALIISNDEELFAFHESASHASSVEIPDKVEFHFVCFTIVGGKLWELDGRKPQPICHGDASDVLADSLNVIQKEFVPHFEKNAMISMIALSKTPCD